MAQNDLNRLALSALPVMQRIMGTDPSYITTQAAEILRERQDAADRHKIGYRGELIILYLQQHNIPIFDNASTQRAATIVDGFLTKEGKNKIRINDAARRAAGIVSQIELLQTLDALDGMDGANGNDLDIVLEGDYEGVSTLPNIDHLVIHKDDHLGIIKPNSSLQLITGNLDVRRIERGSFVDADILTTRSVGQNVELLSKTPADKSGQIIIQEGGASGLKATAVHGEIIITGTVRHNSFLRSNETIDIKKGDLEGAEVRSPEGDSLGAPEKLTVDGVIAKEQPFGNAKNPHKRSNVRARIIEAHAVYESDIGRANSVTLAGQSDEVSGSVYAASKATFDLRDAQQPDAITATKGDMVQCTVTAPAHALVLKKGSIKGGTYDVKSLAALTVEDNATVNAAESITLTHLRPTRANTTLSAQTITVSGAAPATQPPTGTPAEPSVHNVTLNITGNGQLNVAQGMLAKTVVNAPEGTVTVPAGIGEHADITAQTLETSSINGMQAIDVHTLIATSLKGPGRKDSGIVKISGALDLSAADPNGITIENVTLDLSEVTGKVVIPGSLKNVEIIGNKNLELEVTGTLHNVRVDAHEIPGGRFNKSKVSVGVKSIKAGSVHSVDLTAAKIEVEHAFVPSPPVLPDIAHSHSEYAIINNGDISSAPATKAEADLILPTLQTSDYVRAANAHVWLDSADVKVNSFTAGSLQADKAGTFTVGHMDIGTFGTAASSAGITLKALPDPNTYLHVRQTLKASTIEGFKNIEGDAGAVITATHGDISGVTHMHGAMTVNAAQGNITAIQGANAIIDVSNVATRNLSNFSHVRLGAGNIDTLSYAPPPPPPPVFGASPEVKAAMDAKLAAAAAEIDTEGALHVVGGGLTISTLDNYPVISGEENATLTVVNNDVKVRTVTGALNMNVSNGGVMPVPANAVQVGAQPITVALTESELEHYYIATEGDLNAQTVTGFPAVSARDVILTGDITAQGKDAGLAVRSIKAGNMKGFAEVLVDGSASLTGEIVSGECTQGPCRLCVGETLMATGISGGFKQLAVKKANIAGTVADVPLIVAEELTVTGDITNPEYLYTNQLQLDGQIHTAGAQGPVTIVANACVDVQGQPVQQVRDKLGTVSAHGVAFYTDAQRTVQKDGDNTLLAPRTIEATRENAYIMGMENECYETLFKNIVRHRLNDDQMEEHAVPMFLYLVEKAIDPGYEQGNEIQEKKRYRGDVSATALDDIHIDDRGLVPLIRKGIGEMGAVELSERLDGYSIERSGILPNNTINIAPVHLLVAMRQTTDPQGFTATGKEAEQAVQADEWKLLRAAFNENEGLSRITKGRITIDKSGHSLAADHLDSQTPRMTDEAKALEKALGINITMPTVQVGMHEGVYAGV